MIMSDAIAIGDLQFVDMVWIVRDSNKFKVSGEIRARFAGTHERKSHLG